MDKFHSKDQNSHVWSNKLYDQYKKGLTRNYITYEPALRLNSVGLQAVKTSQKTWR